MASIQVYLDIRYQEKLQQSKSNHQYFDEL